MLGVGLGTSAGAEPASHGGDGLGPIGFKETQKSQERGRGGRGGAGRHWEKGWSRWAWKKNSRGTLRPA